MRRGSGLVGAGQAFQGTDRTDRAYSLVYQEGMCRWPGPRLQIQRCTARASQLEGVPVAEFRGGVVKRRQRTGQGPKGFILPERDTFELKKKSFRHCEGLRRRGIGIVTGQNCTGSVPSARSGLPAWLAAVTQHGVLQAFAPLEVASPPEAPEKRVRACVRISGHFPDSRAGPKSVYRVGSFFHPMGDHQWSYRLVRETQRWASAVTTGEAKGRDFLVFAKWRGKVVVVTGRLRASGLMD